MLKGKGQAMNIVELNPILEELEQLAQGTKVAHETEQEKEVDLIKEASSVSAQLRNYQAPAGSVDFHTHVEMMQKKASSVAREVLGLDFNRVGNPTVSEVVDLVFGGGE